MALTLNLTKPGEQGQKLSLNLKKNEAFKVKLSWDGDTDIDLHAIHCINTGAGAKASSFDDILSTYNVQRTIGGQTVGTLTKNSDGTFSIYGGALVHSPDAQDGQATGVDEWINIDPAKLTLPSGGAIEIPLIAMVHQKKVPSKFRDVQNATVTIEDSNGVEVQRVVLTSQFGEFVGVQMGSIIIDSTGTNFHAIGVGFDVDFNGVLGFFS